jgi:hypothetical protein
MKLKRFNQLNEKLSKRVAILKTQEGDWVGLYVDGVLIGEGHPPLGQGHSTTYLLKKSEEYNFKYSDIVEEELNDEDDEYVSNHGSFPKFLKELSCYYEVNMNESSLFNRDRIRVGDKLLCIKDYGFELRPESMPRLTNFEKDKEYEVIEADNHSVRLRSDMPHFWDKSGTKLTEHIFVLKSGSRDFPYLWDYFTKKINYIDEKNINI